MHTHFLPNFFLFLTKQETLEDLQKQDPKKCRASYYWSNIVSQQENPKQALSNFANRWIEKHVENPDTLPHVLSFLQNSFRYTDISGAITHSLGEGHPFRAQLNEWEKQKNVQEDLLSLSHHSPYNWSSSVPLLSSLIETLWSAIDDLDSTQRHSSIWEKHLILEILYRCFSLPFHLAKQLQAYFLTPLKIHLLVGVSSLLVLAISRLCQKYYQAPERLLYLEKCRPIHPPTFPQSEAWEQLREKIQKEGCRIFLTGKAGCGKSSLIESLFYQQKKDPLLQNLTFVHLKIADIATDQNFGYGEILEKIQRKLEPWQDRLVLVVDEAQRLHTHHLIETFRTKIMDPLPRMRCLFATTTAEYAPFTVATFGRRIEEIAAKEPNSEELNHILRSHIAQHSPDWPIPEELLKSIVKKALPEDYESLNTGAISRAIKFLTNIMADYERRLQPSYKSKELIEKEAACTRAVTLLHQETLQGIVNRNHQQQVANLRTEVGAQEQENNLHREKAVKLLKVQQQHKKMRERSTWLARKLLKHPQNETWRKELLLLDFMLLPALAKQIHKLAEETLALPKEVPV